MQLLSVRLMVIAALAASCCASAQTYPNRTIHIVVGFIAGTGKCRSGQTTVCECSA